MKISKYLRVNSGMKWGIKERFLLKSKNRYRHNGYIVLVSERKEWLFEIISSYSLSDYYEDYYVVGIMPSKQLAMVCVKELVNEMYNEHTLTYEALKHK